MNKKNSSNQIIIFFIMLVLSIIAFSIKGNATITITLNSPDNNAWHNTSSILFIYTPISDDDYSISSCSLFTNESGWSNVSTSTSITNNTQNNFSYSLSEGIWLWGIKCVNSNSEEFWSSENRTIKVDGSAPVTSASAVLNDSSSYTFSTWTNSAYVNITLTCDDGSGSGCDVILYCVDSDDSCSPDTSYSSVIQVSDEGVSYVRYFANDSAGNVESVNSEAVKIDRNAPTTYDNAPTGWQNAAFNITITPQDGLSGVSYTTYCLNGNCSNQSGSSEFNIEISTSGNHTLTYL